MKRHPTLLLTALALSAGVLCAQDNPPPRPPDSAPTESPRRPNHDRPPQVASGLFGILDANRDGALDPAELGKAGETLRKFDRNHDKRISQDEVNAPHSRRDADSPDGHARPDGDRPRAGDRAKPPRREEQHGRRPDTRGGERREQLPSARHHDRPQPPQFAQRDARPDAGRPGQRYFIPPMEGARPPFNPPMDRARPPQGPQGPQWEPQPGGPRPDEPDRSGPPSHQRRGGEQPGAGLPPGPRPHEPGHRGPGPI